MTPHAAIGDMPCPGVQVNIVEVPGIPSGSFTKHLESG